MLTTIPGILTSVPTHVDHPFHDVDHHSGKAGKVVNFGSEQVVNFSPESVVNFDWNQWSTWAGERMRARG